MRFDREYEKTGLMLDMLICQDEVKNADDMMCRMHEKYMIESKNLKKLGRVGDALNVLTKWVSDLDILFGKRERLHKKALSVCDRYNALLQKHGIYIQNEE